MYWNSFNTNLIWYLIIIYLTSKWFNESWLVESSDVLPSSLLNLSKLVVTFKFSEWSFSSIIEFKNSDKLKIGNWDNLKY